MFMAFYSNNKSALIVIFAVLLIGGIVFWSQNKPQQEEQSPEQSLWLTATSTAATFKYPETIGTTYVHLQDWPPSVQILNEAFSCTEAGEVTARAGKTELQTIAGRTYCVTTMAEGAAGSVYTQYAYAFPKDDQVVILTFTVRTVQCENYDDPEKTACKTEQASFSPGDLADSIAQTLALNP